MATSGAQRIGDALRACFEAAGGTVQTGRHVASVDELPTHRALLLDLPPRRVAELCGDRLPGAYRRKLERYVHGPGAFKVDWALREPIPWTDPACRGAGTVHVGGTLEQIAEGEAAAWEGRHVDRPFVLLVQPSVADPSRAPEGRHTAWGYCHVPNGSTVDMTDAIESQVERFAPGFRDVVLARHTMHTADFEQWNPNLIGGDIVGGAAKLSQLFTRPVPRWCPYSTPDRSIYLCSASTPPGAGVHGMCGHHAALAVLRRRFPELDIEGAANERE
jgi:phytoene dehydrogenase-like protein